MPLQEGVAYDADTGRKIVARVIIRERLKHRVQIPAGESLPHNSRERRCRKAQDLMTGKWNVRKGMPMYDYFISFKCTSEGVRTRDCAVAREIYEALRNAGEEVFFSDEELQKNGIAQYMQEINNALRDASVFILVASDPQFLKEGWVAQEWSSYLNLMMSDSSKKMFTILIGIGERDLPALLGPLQSFRYENGMAQILQHLLQAKNQRSKDDSEGSVLKCIDATLALSGWKDEAYLNAHYSALKEKYPEVMHYLMAAHLIETQNYAQAKPQLEELLKERSVLGAYLMGRVLKKGYGVPGNLKEAKRVLAAGQAFWEEFADKRRGPTDEVLFLVYEKSRTQLTAAEYMAAAISLLMECYGICSEISGLYDWDAEELQNRIGGYKQILLVTDDLTGFFPGTEREQNVLKVLSEQDRKTFSVGMHSMRMANLPKGFRKYSAYELQRQGIARYCRHLLQDRVESQATDSRTEAETGSRRTDLRQKVIP